MNSYVRENSDITTTNADIIFHQVNCKGVMGAGVAKQIRDKWPGVYGSYLSRLRGWERDGYKALGCYDSYKTPDGKEVVSLFAQDAYGRDGKKYTSYDAMELSLRRWLKSKDENTLRYKALAFPYGMGAGLGGGEWEVVRAIIESVLKDTQCDIYYCKKD